MSEDKLAIEGGAPVRTEPLPLEFPGLYGMGEEEIQAVARVLRAKSPFRYYGPDRQHETERFEAEFAGFNGARHAIAVASGTGALHVALSALGVGPGQEVIVPAYMWVAVAGAAINHGAIPVLADIDGTFCLDPRGLERRIGPKTAGIMMVHMSGAPGDVEAVAAIAKKKGLWLLEDCAQCAGGTVGGRRVGTFGDIATFSFQINKNMTSGEGGCVVTSDERLYRRAFASHDLGYARNEAGRLILDDPSLQIWGRGYRMDEMRAAVLRVQLRRLPATIAAMRASKHRVRAALERFEAVRLRRLIDPAGDTGCFLITTYRDAGTARRVSDALRAEGIRTAPQGVTNIVMTEWGLHLYYNIPSLRARASVDRAGFPWRLAENAGLGGDYEKGACPAADALFERSVLIAIPPCLTRRDEDDIVRAFEKVLPAVAARGAAGGED